MDEVTAVSDPPHRRGLRASWTETPARLWARSRNNTVRSFRILRRRWARRRSNIFVIDWIGWTWFSITIVGIAAVVLDAPVGAALHPWPPAVRDMAAHLTNIGLGGWYIVPAALVLLVVNLTDWDRLSRRGLLIAYNWCCLAEFVLLSTGLSGLIATIAKRLIGRARPMHFQELGLVHFNPLSADASFAGFPSGHAVILGSLAAAITLLMPRLRYVAIPLAIALAATRIVVGAHYPSDVLAGLAFGAGFTVMMAVMFARLGYVFRQRPSGLPVRKRSFRVFW